MDVELSKELLFVATVIPFVIAWFIKEPFGGLFVGRWTWVTKAVSLTLSLLAAWYFSPETDMQTRIIAGLAVWLMVSGAYQEGKDLTRSVPK